MSADAVLYDASGSRIVPSIPMSREDAEALRNYKAFLQRNGYVEGHLFCERCQVDDRGNVSMNDVARIAVGTEKIGIACGCRMLFYHGRTL